MDDAEKEIRRIKAAFRRTFNHDSGRIVLKYLEDTYIFASPYVKGDPDASKHNVGKQWLALEIRSLADQSIKED